MPEAPPGPPGRCGSCAYFHSVRPDPARGVDVGECSFGTWPPTRPATSSCPAYVPAGQLATRGPAKVKRAVQGRMRPDRPDDDDFDYNERRQARAPAGATGATGATGTAAGEAAVAHDEDARATGAVRVREQGAGTPALATRAPIEIEVDMDEATFRSVLREILADELRLSDTPIGERWRGGELVLKPGRDGLQEKRLPLETFFKKIVMIRDKLRVLEQKINGSPQLSAEDKVTLQQYITGAYGSLTTFNVLFRDETDKFVGSGEKE